MKNIEYTAIGDYYSTNKETVPLQRASNYPQHCTTNLSLLSELAEISLESQDPDTAIAKATQSLAQTRPLHANSVKSWCLLLKSLLLKHQQDEALFALDYHCGPYHPLHSAIYTILASRYIEEGKYEDALSFYNSH